MIKHLIRDESGMTMGLAVIMIVLIGVLGAGLLTFVTTDVRSMAQTNRGQQALQSADAGVQAAKQQLISDDAAITGYDGGADDRPWSYCYNVSGCSGSSPTATGSNGMTLNMDAGTARVTILLTGYAPATYRVISEGQAGDARRKIEAIIKSDAEVTFPRTYMSRTNLELAGSINPSAISFFALRNATIGNNVDLGSQADRYYGRWAETSPCGTGPYPNSAGCYPNASNVTARSTALSAVAAQGTVCSGSHPSQTRGSRVLSGTGTTTCAAGTGTLTSPRVVPDYNGSTLDPAQKIAFPFQVPTETEDKAELEVLRQRALLQETRSNPLYIDRDPGNQIDDPGMDNRTTSTPMEITNWPSPSNYDTVRFYKFQSYNTNNVIRYNNGDSNASCSSTNPPKGVIVVQNGDFVYDGNRAFNGGIIVRAYNSSDVSVPTQGKFTASGNPCLKGYANSGGTLAISGNISLGDVPELGTLGTFRGGMEQISWRELFG